MRRLDRVEISCKNCGKGFDIPVNLLGRRKFCSKKCGYHNNHIVNPIISSICPVCQNRFEYKSYKGKVRIFCSTKCRGSDKMGKILKPPPDKDGLLSFYAVHTLSETALNYGVDGSVIKKWLKLYNAEVRNKSESAIQFLGGKVRHPITKEKISSSLVGHKVANETRDKISRTIKSNPELMKSLSDGHSGKNAPIFKNESFRKWGRVKFKSGRAPDLGDTWFRSSWERNYARYLNWLVSIGEILKWEYEPDTFWFEKIRRGTRSYTPDFKLFEKGGGIVYHELKGRETSQDRTKWRRMNKYYPNVKLIIVGSKDYSALTRQMKGLIPEWE